MCDAKRVGWNLLKSMSQAQLSRSLVLFTTIFESLCAFKSLLVWFQHNAENGNQRGNNKRNMAESEENTNRKLKRGSASLISDEARTGQCNVGNAVHQVKILQNNTPERELKQNRKKEKRKRKGRINSIFSAHHVFLILPVDPGPVHMSAHLRHMFLLLHDRLWRKYRKTVSVCALGGGREGRGWSKTDKASFPTMSSTFI